MLRNILLLALVILPGFGFSQGIDTATAIRRVDSLIQVSRTLTGQRDFDKALEISVSAEKLALENVGRETAAYGSCCHNHGRVLHYIGDYPGAEKWYLEAIAIREKALGREHADYAASLGNLASLYSTLGQFDKAEQLNIESLAIIEKSLGKHHADYAMGLGNLANLYVSMDHYEKAELLLLEAKAIQEKTLTKEHPDYARSLNNLANVYSIMGHFEKAEPLRLEARAIMEKSLGKEHPDYAKSVNNLAVLYKNMGLYEKAELLHREALAIREKILGKEHIDFAQSLNNLAVLYKDMGDYEKAETLHLQDIAIRAKTFSKEHPNYARSLNNLANLYRDKGDYQKAELLYLEAKAIQEKTRGREHYDYAKSLNDLANLYSDMGSYEEAEPLYLEAIAIIEKTLGKEHADHTAILNNLAVLYGDMGTYDKALRLYLEANVLLEKSVGKEHPDYAANLNNLAVLYYDMGDYVKAELNYLQAKAIREKVLGKEHPDYAASLDNLTNLFVKMGNYGQAEPIYLEAKAIREKSVGKEHPKYAASLTNLANLYVKMGNYEKAEPLLDELAYLHQSMISSAIHYLSERELNNYVNKFSKSQAQMLSFAQLSAGKSTRIQSVCYDNILFYKGFLLNTANQLKRLVLFDSIATEKLNLLKSYERRLAAEYSKPITERINAPALEVKVNDLEKELARTVTGYGEAMQQVRWQEVQQKLQAGEVAVEFIHYHFYGEKETDSTMYAALLLRHDDAAPQFVPLFEERELTQLLKGAKGGNFPKINSLYYFQPNDDGQKSLYDLIWKPLESKLQDVEAVYCSPSGLLHRINLGALAVNEGETFSDHREVVVLNSTRQLVTTTTINYDGDDGHIVGGVRYALDSNSMESFIVYYATRSLTSPNDSLFRYDLSFQTDSANRGSNWNYLPQTAIEALDIHQLLQASSFTTQLDTGYHATEESFRNFGREGPSPRVLHIATHGFFFFPDPKESVGHGQIVIREEPIFKTSEHPMIRSGLIMAGAQHAWSTGKPPEHREDGILTAYEITQMNLANTELVVLSACETGLGDIEGNEGVYGLQRAFKIAGAKYLIMSLWKVNDQSTRELMTDFYGQWLESGLSIPDAFHKAQQNCKAKYKDPYHWAGFVLVE